MKPKETGQVGDMTEEVTALVATLLATERRPQYDQSYFRLLPFAPADITCLALRVLPAQP